MKLTTIFAFALVSWAQTLSTSAMAADGKSDAREQRVRADTAESFAATAAEVRRQMSASGGRYEFIRPEEKGNVNADLDSMSAMFQKFGSVAAMNQPEKVQLFNTQEHLNGLLTHNDRDRLVCEHRPPMGSNIAVTSCKTVAEVEKMRRDSQKLAMDQESNGWKCRGARAGTGCATGAKMGN